MKDFLGFGVAGNFANHLEQAGEANDFADIKTDKDAPKGIFPFYIPQSPKILGRYCINNDTIILPPNKDSHVQAEPEVGLECEILYKDNKVIDVQPKFFMAFNDTSVRNDKAAKKLSLKKNFSNGSKAIGHTKIPIDTFTSNGICEQYSIASFIESSDGVVEPYGEASTLNGYSYFYSQLVDWIIQKLNTQEDFSVLENLSEVIKEAKYPKNAIFAVGATRYIPKNEHRFLQDGDRIVIAVFNHHTYTLKEIEEIAKNKCIPSDLKDISIINQKVVQG